MVTQTLQGALDQAVKMWRAGASEDPRGGAGAHSYDVTHESDVGFAPYCRRARKARNQCVAIHGEEIHGQGGQAAFPDVASFP